MPNDRRRMILEGPVPIALFRLAMPIMLGTLLQTGYQLTDAFWVGRIGAAAIAAVAISTPVTFLVIVTGSGFAMAGATLSAQYMGAGQQEKVDQVAGQTLLMVGLISIVLGAAGYLLTPSLLDWLDVAPSVHDGALGFMQVSFVGVIFVFVYTMFQALMRGVGQTRSPLIIVSVTVALNFLLDPLFIFGWGPVAPRGVMGAALATLITQALAALVGIVILVLGRQGIRLSASHFVPDLAYIRKAFLMGLPASVEMATRGLGPMALSMMAVGFGTVATAAYGIGSNIMMFTIIPAMGLAMAVATLVGQNIGAGKVDRAAAAAETGAIWGGVLLGCLGAIAWIWAEPLVSFFAPGEPAVVADGARFVRIMSPTWACIGVQLSLIFTLRACGNMVTAMVIALAFQIGFQIPLAWLLLKFGGLGLDGLWWSFPATNVAAVVVTGVWFARGYWKKGRLTAPV